MHPDSPRALPAFPLLAALLFVTLAATVPAAAAEALLRLSSEQLRSANVAFEPATAVSAAGPGAGNSGAALRLTGRAVVPNSALDVVLAPVAGRIESLLVNPGQTVRAGQTLARLHSAEILGMQRQLVGARAQAELARSRLERDQALFDEGIIARNRLVESEAASGEASAVLSEQRQLLRLAGLSEATINRIRSAADISPLLPVAARRAGTVVQQDATPGQQVDAGDPLFQVATLGTLWLELQATREQARRIGNGDRVTVPACTGPGQVIAAGSQLDPRSQTSTVRVEMQDANDCLTPNQFVEAHVVPRAAGADLLRVPASGLIQHEGRDYILVREAEGLRPVAVSIERRDGGSAWVRGALKAGDAVASSGLAALKGSWLGLGATAPAPETR